jgi:hypothetical protein
MKAIIKKANVTKYKDMVWPGNTTSSNTATPLNARNRKFAS